MASWNIFLVLVALVVPYAGGILSAPTDYPPPRVFVNGVEVETLHEISPDGTRTITRILDNINPPPLWGPDEYTVSEYQQTLDRLRAEAEAEAEALANQYSIGSGEGDEFAVTGSDIIDDDSQPADECPICLERMAGPPNRLVTLMCGHKFHIGCIRRWKFEPHRSNPKCPMCRSDI